MRGFLLSYFLLPVSFAVTANAAIIERTVEVSTKDKNPTSARRDLNEKANQKVIEQMVIETIGEERYQKNKSIVDLKILRLASRLIPFARPGNLEPQPDGFKMTVLLKVNQDGLDQILQQNNLLFEADVQPLILPVVVWTDSVDQQTWAWWSQSESPMFPKIWSQFEQTARSSFLKNGFYVVRPQFSNLKEGVAIPSSTSLSLNEIQNLAATRNIQVAITGDVQISNSTTRSGGFAIDVKMAVLHLPRNRNLAQVARKVESEVGVKQTVVAIKLKEVMESMLLDLSGQTLEAWQRGTAQSNNYKVTLLGQIPISVQEAFREGFKNKARDIKAVRERFITSQQITFEIDSPTGLKDLSQRVREIEVSNGKMVLKEVLESELKYQWQNK